MCDVLQSRARCARGFWLGVAVARPRQRAREHLHRGFGGVPVAFILRERAPLRGLGAQACSRNLALAGRAVQVPLEDHKHPRTCLVRADAAPIAELDLRRVLANGWSESGLPCFPDEPCRGAHLDVFRSQGESPLAESAGVSVLIPPPIL